MSASEKDPGAESLSMCTGIAGSGLSSGHTVGASVSHNAVINTGVALEVLKCAFV